MSQLLRDGQTLLEDWCGINGVKPPKITIYTGEPEFEACAYYRDGEIHIWPFHCATPGYSGRQWSWPGYVVDRTPYGVLQHELGHHVSLAHGARFSAMADDAFRATEDKPITGYAPNKNEWFAEIFRLFVTNPDLLRLIRPKMHAWLSRGWQPTVLNTWEEVLTQAGAPERYVNAARNKIKKVKP